MWREGKQTSLKFSKKSLVFRREKFKMNPKLKEWRKNLLQSIKLLILLSTSSSIALLDWIHRLQVRCLSRLDLWSTQSLSFQIKTISNFSIISINQSQSATSLAIQIILIWSWAMISQEIYGPGKRCHITFVYNHIQ